jgi:hypothetical protein
LKIFSLVVAVGGGGALILGSRLLTKKTTKEVALPPTPTHATIHDTHTRESTVSKAKGSSRLPLPPPSHPHSSQLPPLIYFPCACLRRRVYAPIYSLYAIMYACYHCYVWIHGYYMARGAIRFRTSATSPPPAGPPPPPPTVSSSAACASFQALTLQRKQVAVSDGQAISLWVREIRNTDSRQ